MTKTAIEKNHPRVTLAIPCFNPTQDQWSRLSVAICEVVQSGLELFEVLVVDDGSTHWVEPPTELLTEHKQLRLIRLPKNKGKGGALREAVRQASQESSIFVFTDFDMPYRTRDLVGVSRAVTEGVDICIADRSAYFLANRSDRMSRTLGHELFKFICRVFITGGLFDTQAGLKAFKTEALRAIVEISVVDSFIFDVEWLYIGLRHRLALRCWPIQVLDSHASGQMRSMKYLRLLRDMFKIGQRIVLRKYDSRQLVQFVLRGRS